MKARMLASMLSRDGNEEVVKLVVDGKVYPLDGHKLSTRKTAEGLIVERVELLRPKPIKKVVPEPLPEAAPPKDTTMLSNEDIKKANGK